MAPNLSTLILVATSITIIHTVSFKTVATSSARTNRLLFANELFHAIAKDRTNENVIVSPASIQTCMALAYFAGKGKTAEELQRGLRLGDSLSKQQIAENFRQLLVSQSKPHLKMANRIYIKKGNEIASQFSEIASRSFNSNAELVNFSDSDKTIEKINRWVKSETNNKIENLIKPGGVDSNTEVVLVNAIYFKAAWLNDFSVYSTRKQQFFISPTSSVDADMMFVDDRFKYGVSEILDAKFLEMPYKNSNLSMLIMLPNKIDGLRHLQENLKFVNIQNVSANMRKRSVDVFFPKFKIEFDLSLKDALNDMGMSNLFSDRANFSGFLTSGVPLKVSEIHHKAFIEINEAGSEAQAASFLKAVPMSFSMDREIFRADHPFIFFIKSKKAVYFAGHVAKF